jgi:flagellin-like protein
MKKRKAVSPLVSTILLVMIVIVLAFIIILWSGIFLSEMITKEIGGQKKSAEQYCSEISIQTFINPDGSFGFKNTGNVPIYSYNLKLSLSGTSKIKEILPVQGLVNPGYSTLVKDPDTGSPIDYNLYEEIKIIPIILGKDKSGNTERFTCSEKDGVVV